MRHEMRVGTLLIGLVVVVLSLVQPGCPGEKEEKVNPCIGVTCSGQGVCTVQTGEAHCECYLGYKNEGLECVKDETAKTAEEIGKEVRGVEEEGEPENVTSTGGSGVTPENDALLATLVDVRKAVLEKIPDCKLVQEKVLTLLASRQELVKTLAGRLPAYAQNPGTGKKMLRTRERMQKIWDGIGMLSRTMRKLKATCPAEARNIGRVMGAVKICAYNVEDATVIACLDTEEWTKIPEKKPPREAKAADVTLIISVVDGVEEIVRENLSDCQKTLKMAIEHFLPRKWDLEEVVKLVGPLALNAGSKDELQTVREVMTRLEQSIARLNETMLLMKMRCPKHSEAVGEVLGLVKICALKPGDGSILNCLQTEKW